MEEGVDLSNLVDSSWEENYVYEDENIEVEDEFTIDELFDQSKGSTEAWIRSDDAVRWCNENNPYFKNNEWQKIYQNMLRMGELEKSVIWHDTDALSIAQFAVSKMALEQLSIKKWNSAEKSLNKEYRQCFLRLVDRTIELNPSSSKFRSSKAYFFYSYYLSGHHEETDFQDACELLSNLAENPLQRFKDAQRYVKLRQKRIEKPKHKDEFKLLGLCTEYEYLINIYRNLSEGEQKRCQRNFMACEYSYVKLQMDDLWNNALSVFFHYASPWVEAKPKYLDWKDKESAEHKARKEILEKCWYYLKDLSNKIPESETKESVQNKNKVNFLHLKYRKSQRQNIVGIISMLMKNDLEITEKYFADASNMMKETLEKAAGLIKNGALFNYPWYMYNIYAVSEFAIGNYAKAAKVLISVPDGPKTHGYYVSARNMLDRMLPYFQKDLFFENKPDGMHIIIKNYISAEVRKELKLAGLNFESKANPKAVELFNSGEKIGPADFVYLIDQVYRHIPYPVTYKQRVESIQHIRNAVAGYAHYMPEHDDLLKNDEDRIKAFYYSAERNIDRMRDKEIDRFRLKKAFTEIFKNEIIATLSKISINLDKANTIGRQQAISVIRAYHEKI